MKKYYTLVFILSLFSVKAFTQSFSLQNLNNVLQADASSFQIEGTVDVLNNSSSAKDVMMYRVINILAPGHESSFCWGLNCYGAATDTSTYPESMAPGSTSLARADLRPYNFPGLSRVTYCWYDLLNPSDTVCLEFTYDVTTVGIHEVYNSKTDFITRPHPNPADDNAMIVYHVLNRNADSRIVVYNVIGSKIQEVKLDNSKQDVKINTSLFQAGVYYYSLISGGKVVGTNKLIVSHKN